MLLPAFVSQPLSDCTLHPCCYGYSFWPRAKKQCSELFPAEQWHVRLLGVHYRNDGRHNQYILTSTLEQQQQKSGVMRHKCKSKICLIVLQNIPASQHIWRHVLFWTKALERPCNPCSSILTFVIFSRSGSENIIISLTLTAQLVGFISSHWFLTHGVLYIQTDGSSLLPNPPCPTALFPFIWPPLIQQIWPCRLHVEERRWR